MLTEIVFSATAVFVIMVVGCLIGRRTKAVRSGLSKDVFWKVGMGFAVADMLAVIWLYAAVYRLNGQAPDSVASALASIFCVALAALLIPVCGYVVDETNNPAWVAVMILAFAGTLILAVQYQPVLSKF